MHLVHIYTVKLRDKVNTQEYGVIWLNMIQEGISDLCVWSNYAMLMKWRISIIIISTLMTYTTTKQISIWDREESKPFIGNVSNWGILHPAFQTKGSLYFSILEQHRSKRIVTRIACKNTHFSTNRKSRWNQMPDIICTPLFHHCYSYFSGRQYIPYRIRTQLNVHKFTSQFNCQTFIRFQHRKCAGQEYDRNPYAQNFYYSCSLR